MNNNDMRETTEDIQNTRDQNVEYDQNKTITGTPGELAKDNRRIVPDQEIATAAELTN